MPAVGDSTGCPWSISCAKPVSLGYSAVQLRAKRPHLSILDYRTRESVAPIRQAAEAAGVEIATIAAYTDFTAGRESPEVPQQEIQLAYIRQLAQLASWLAAKTVRVFSGYLTGPERLAADWDRVVITLREAASITAEHGVVLGLQNHHDLGVTADSERLAYRPELVNYERLDPPWARAVPLGDVHRFRRLLCRPA